ncbi:TetR/AcrR family transcriptional regulator [Micromonospora endolithica]|uniref:TetR family transcriptional regulator n=1 Tax=Micromonospora endolithica TaxID=230091 RepID=A0A3A9ZGK8_9ACTN|nr:TetR family transcriptional regulator [Micromonospora endolithica]RKN47493.1 TetR family transcriptional regulator [Micromonospora endolithica]TWJ21127.1 TetR family transcriptional regulator [Micromonospora endolithica]
MVPDTSTPPGLRERKKQQTRLAIYEAALELFVAEGFDRVSMTQIAEAANVSKATVFNYFPSKEDLIMVAMREAMTDPGKPVRARAPGESVLDALRRAFLDELDRRESHVGLDAGGLGFMRVVRSSPALAGRVMLLDRHREVQLAQALAEETGAAPGDMTPNMVAAAVLGAMRAVSSENWRRLVDGESPDAIHPDAVAAAERLFDVLTEGLAGYGVRPLHVSEPPDKR